MPGSWRRVVILVAPVLALCVAAGADIKLSPSWGPYMPPRDRTGEPQPEILIDMRPAGGNLLSCWYDNQRWVAGRHVWWCWSEHSTRVGFLEKHSNTLLWLRSDAMEYLAEFRVGDRRPFRVDPRTRYSSQFDLWQHWKKPPARDFVLGVLTW
jgi:hypothetical protein